MQDPILLSIIIVNWKVRDLLRECLISIDRSTELARPRYEVVMVDNDSGDGSVEMVSREFPEVVLLANAKNVGFGAANNQALRHCRGKRILLLNPDTVVPPGSIDRLLERMESMPGVAVLGCRLENADGSLQKWTGGAFPTLLNLVNHYFFIDRILPSAWRPAPLYLDRDVARDLAVGWVSGACMMLRRELVGETIFSPDFFMYGEDMELCFRMHQAGYGVVYTPAVSITHYQGMSMRQQKGEILLSSLKGPRQFYRMTRGAGSVGLFDRVTLLGFFVRWVLYSVGSLTGDVRMRERALSSRHYTQIIRTLMREERAKRVAR